MTLTLGYSAPYDWPAVIEFLAARAIPGVEVVERERYRRTIELGDCQGIVEVAPMPRRNELAATIRFADVTALPAIVARLRHVFDLGSDAGAIGAHLAEDPWLAPLVAARPGLRVPGAWDGFELAVRAVLGQQITVGAARQLAGRLVAAHGTALAFADAGLTAVFPRPERIAAADLATLGMPRARAATLSAVAAAVVADPSLFRPDRGVETAVARLRALPGIGEWTAQYIALRALREPDAFPAADIGLLRAMTSPDGVRPTPAALLARAERWRPWRAYAAQHLWTAGRAAIGARPPSRQEAVP